MKPSALVFVATVICSATVAAQEQVEAIGTRQPSREREVVYGTPVSSGTVIVAGRRLPLPYRVGRQGRFVLVNGERIAEMPGRTPDGKEKHESGDPNRFIANIEYWLHQDYAIVVFDERIRIVAESDGAARFLRSLGEAKSLDERVATALTWDVDISDDGMPHRIPTAQWQGVLTEFRVTDGVRAFIDEYDEQSDDEDDDEANYLAPPDTSAKKMYALSVAGMVLVALSIGTLLNHRPQSGRWSELVRSPEAVNLIKRALVLIVALSAFDLACTLFATTAGDFLEVNPFGESLLSKPWMLSTFKLTATVFGAGILWSMRSYLGAQQASWWLCLVLTLVTVRWVAVQSLFFV
ncbi:MAG: hypothetical protein H6822_22545 [Planctomycetaceae bacterium]|nr:hypothetical protein [Planctomycetales bacterium]MCB9924975.1 hypothetical protein [Planctomycetaceae bacterium]